MWEECDCFSFTYGCVQIPSGVLIRSAVWCLEGCGQRRSPGPRAHWPPGPESSQASATSSFSPLNAAKEKKEDILWTDWIAFCRVVQYSALKDGYKNACDPHYSQLPRECEKSLPSKALAIHSHVARVLLEGSYIKKKIENHQIRQDRFPATWLAVVSLFPQSLP